MNNLAKKKGVNPKLQPQFNGPFLVKNAYPNHTYRLDGLKNIINESRLKLYRVNPSTEARRSELVYRDSLQNSSAGESPEPVRQEANPDPEMCSEAVTPKVPQPKKKSRTARKSIVVYNSRLGGSGLTTSDGPQNTQYTTRSGRRVQPNIYLGNEIDFASSYLS